MKTMRADLEKSQKNTKKYEIGETCFLTIFWIAKKLICCSKMGQNHSPAQARERQEIEKNGVRLLHRFCLVLGGASGRVFR